jgi:hypothetical protein
MFVFKRLSTAKGFYQYAVLRLGTIDLLEENTINSITILCKQILQLKNTTKIISKNSLSFKALG